MKTDNQLEPQEYKEHHCLALFRRCPQWADGPWPLFCLSPPCVQHHDGEAVDSCKSAFAPAVK